jgi:ATP-dependent DNA helicase RecG
MKRRGLEGMRREDLNKLLRLESESVEWKRSLGEWKEIVVAAAALASLHGGQICIGVEPTGKVCGIEVGKGTLEDLANKIAQGTSPRLMPEERTDRTKQ